MTPRLNRLFLLPCLLLLALPAASCGPDWLTAIFVRQYGPDEPYATYTAGRLGVLRSTYRVRHLAIAYNILTGRALSGAEQAAAATVDRGRGESLLDATADPAQSASGLNAWVKARAALGPLDGYLPAAELPTERSVAGQYDTFPNCLDDAFATAARTLAARAAAHNAHSPEVMEWVRGQDQVFLNCGDTPARMVNGAYQAPTSPKPLLPAPLTNNAPLWLAQDRAYQTAAAHFYAVQYTEARAGFEAIAADHASPWRGLAPYLAVRAHIREASLAMAVVNDSGADQEARKAAIARELAGLRQAQRSLIDLRADPRMGSLRHSIDGLLDYLALRLDPQAQLSVLAGRLHAPGDPTFGQDLVDLTYATAHPAPGGAADVDQPQSTRIPAPAAPLTAGSKPEVAMLAWLEAVRAADHPTATVNWRALHSSPWLLAALMSTQSAGQDTPELLKAADGLPASDPAWAAVTFHRLRLSPRTPAMRAALLTVLPVIKSTQGPSAINLFSSLDASTAPDLTTWLASAGRIPAADDQDGDEIALNAPVVTDGSKPADQPCGPALAESQLPLFTPNAADALNTRMPLAVLATAAESSVLPPNLRFALAQATWTRAVLLEQPAIAHRMSPILTGCRAAWQPMLAAYDGAQTINARHVAGLLALMRFASTEPNVRPGTPRNEGFATYSELRDNWWNKTVTPALDLAKLNSMTGPGQTTSPEVESDSGDRANAMLVPGSLEFLTTEDRATAQSEIKRLITVPAASDYFAGEALGWWHAHPHDPADADLLGEAMRVARNAPRTDNTPANQHALFEALQGSFPQSSWAKRYTTWE